MPDYADLNFFEAKRDLPEFYWSGETKMLCLAQAVDATKKVCLRASYSETNGAG